MYVLRAEFSHSYAAAAHAPVLRRGPRSSYLLLSSPHARGETALTDDSAAAAAERGESVKGGRRLLRAPSARSRARWTKARTLSFLA